MYLLAILQIYSLATEEYYKFPNSWKIVCICMRWSLKQTAIVIKVVILCDDEDVHCWVVGGEKDVFNCIFTVCNILIKRHRRLSRISVISFCVVGSSEQQQTLIWKNMATKANSNNVYVRKVCETIAQAQNKRAEIP